jgi:dUTP pyrophosphatase
MTIFKIELLRGGVMPKKSHKTDAAYDIYAAEDYRLNNINSQINVYGLHIKNAVVVRARFKIAMEWGWKANILPRSGLAAKHEITVLNAPGTIDADYREEVGVIMLNLSNVDYHIKKGDRIAQMDFQRVYDIELEEVDSVNKVSDSRDGGFGSTGL